MVLFAPKSTRLVDTPLKTRVAQKGELVVEVRDDDKVTLLTIPWEMVYPSSKD